MSRLVTENSNRLPLSVALASESHDDVHDYRTDLVSTQEFDRIVSEFDDLSIDQIASYKIEEQSGRTSLFLSYENGEVVGAAVVVIYSVPVLDRGVANVRFGPLWRRRGREANPDCYRRILQQLVQEYSINRGLMLTILPRPHPSFQRMESEILTSCGFSSRRPPATSPRHFVNLALSPDAQMKSLGQKWRYNLRKSGKNTLTIVRDDGQEAHRAFAAIHDGMQVRKQTRLADRLDIIPSMRNLLPDDIHPRTYVAKSDGAVVAGAIVLGFGDTAYYLFGATNHAGLDLRAGYALQWHIVNQLAAEEFKFYDLGGSSRVDGLRQFKKGLSGRAGLEIDMPDEYDYCQNQFANLFGQSVHRLRYLKNDPTHFSRRISQLFSH